MLGLAQRHKVGVISVIVLYKHALILEPYYRDTISIVFREGGDAQTER
jgi:hypothetical protein